MSDSFDADDKAELPPAPPPVGFPSYPPPASPSSLGDALGPGQASYPLASYGARAGGFLLDLLIVWAAMIAIGVLLAVLRAGVLILVVYLGPVLYTWLMIGKGGGQTLGMRAAAVRCIDATTGGQVSLGKALGRSLAFAVFFILPIIGPLLDLLWPAWDTKVQTLHDKMAGTVVISAKTTPAQIRF